MQKKLIGKITRFFDRINVAVIELTDSIELGDKILIKGNSSTVKTQVSSIEIVNTPIEKAGAGQAIGLKVDAKVNKGDIVYKTLE